MSEHLLQQGTRGPTAQRAQAPLTSQVPNSEGGYVWQVDKWTRLRRFLILGSEGGNYYAGERQLTTANAKSLHDCIAEDGGRVVREVVEISEAGRAPKNDTCLYALAACLAMGDPDTKLEAGLALRRVARIGTHLFDFVSYAQSMRGWGRTLRRAVQGWYNDKSADQLAYDVVKYRQRNGWSHRDVLRKAHPKAVGGFDHDELPSGHGLIYNFVTHGVYEASAFPIIDGYVAAQTAETAAETAFLAREFRLPREALQTEHLNDVRVWQALLDTGMPLGAMTRNLATMTRNGVLEGEYRQIVIDALTDPAMIAKARLHPYALLLALSTYRSGHGYRSGNTWKPINQIIDALDEAYYLSFGNVVPTGKKILLALDVSGSMYGARIGDSMLTAAEGAGAMATVTAAVEANVDCVTFSSGPSAWMKRDGNQAFRWHGLTDGLEPFSISKRRRLDDMLNEMKRRGERMGGTDCALPMTYAADQQLDYDAFVIYTDSETWAGDIHPFEALRAYRQKSRNVTAKLVVVGMTANEFSIADPNDAGMMDVVGFDTAAPNMISDFIAGNL